MKKTNKNKKIRRVGIRIAIGIAGLVSLLVGIGVGSFITTKGLLEIRIDNSAIGIDFRGNNISLSPSKVWISNVTAGSKVEQYIYVKNNGKEDVELDIYTNIRWVSFDDNRIGVAANSTTKVHIFIDIPSDFSAKDKPVEFLVGVKKTNPDVNIITCAKYFLDIK